MHTLLNTLIYLYIVLMTRMKFETVLHRFSPLILPITGLQVWYSYILWMQLNKNEVSEMFELCFDSYSIYILVEHQTSSIISQVNFLKNKLPFVWTLVTPTQVSRIHRICEVTSTSEGVRAMKKKWRGQDKYSSAKCFLNSFSVAIYLFSWSLSQH